MELSNSAGLDFFKFKEVGDTIAGSIVEYRPDVPGRYGPENLLTLDVEGRGRVVVKCPASLSRTIAENLTKIPPGTLLTIEFTGTKPTTKGSPMKVFKVHADDPNDAADVSF